MRTCKVSVTIIMILTNTSGLNMALGYYKKIGDKGDICPRQHTHTANNLPELVIRPLGTPLESGNTAGMQTLALSRVLIVESLIYHCTEAPPFVYIM